MPSFRAKFRKRHPRPGARPGTLSVPSEAAETKVTLIEYCRDQAINVKGSKQDLIESIERDASGVVWWLDIQGFSDQRFLHLVAKRFDLHPLLLADIVNVPQRPRVDPYPGQVLIIVRMVRTDGGEISSEQVSIVVTENVVITFQEQHGDVFDPIRKRIRDSRSFIRQSGTDYLAYALVDTVVDGYYPVLEFIGEKIETMESICLRNPTPDLLRSINEFKNELVQLRRATWAQREAINSLVRDRYDLISDDVRLYLRDVYDHTIQVAEVIEMYREIIGGLINVYLSSLANRTNDVMKVLTIVATVFIPLTFLAGIYGMNFEYMPELHYRWAYPIVWLVMLLMALGMIVLFRKRGWITGYARTNSDSGEA